MAVVDHGSGLQHRHNTHVVTVPPIWMQIRGWPSFLICSGGARERLYELVPVEVGRVVGGLLFGGRNFLGKAGRVAKLENSLLRPCALDPVT